MPVIVCLYTINCLSGFYLYLRNTLPLLNSAAKLRIKCKKHKFFLKFFFKNICLNKEKILTFISVYFWVFGFC